MLDMGFIREVRRIVSTLPKARQTMFLSATLPAAIAGRFTRTLGRTMVLASGLSIAFTTIGLAVSYQPDLPAGATIILVAGTAYLLVAGGQWLRTIRR